MPNRESRRLLEKKKKALAKTLTYLDKTEEKRIWFQEGYMSCRRASYVSTALLLQEKGFSQDDIVTFLQNLDDALAFYTGEDEQIESGLKKLGIIFDFKEAFSSDRIKKEE